MPLWPAAKLMDTVVGVDVHAVTPVPGIPVHPYVGPIYLWTDPAFPRTNVFINGVPAMTVGSMGYFVHVPQGVPVNPPNLPYWKRYFSNAAMGVVLMGLTTLANVAIAGISALVPKPPEAEAFLKDVTGIDTSSRAAAWESVKGAFAGLTQWMTWAKLLMPPVPYPGAQGSIAVGSPNVTVNGGPLGIVAPLVATSCSDLPFVPNGMTLGFSNVLVGVSFADILRGIAVDAAQGALSAGAAAGVGAVQSRRQARQNSRCGRPGEPIDPVTGAAENEWVDFQAHDEPTWRLERAYSSAWAAEDGPFGFGFRAGFQRELVLLDGGHVVYVDERKRPFPFSPDGAGAFPESFDGYTLERRDRSRFVLRHPRHGAQGFERDPGNPGRARLAALKLGGAHHAFTYDEHGRLAGLRQTAVNEGHRVVDTRFRYDGSGHLVEVVRGDAGGTPATVAEYAYDRAGNLVVWRDPVGAETSYAYDRAHRMRRLTDRRGYSFHYRYDGQGRCVESSGDDGLWHVKLRYGLDRTFVTEGDGGLWVYVFDESGTIREVIDPYGGVARREVGADGRVTAEVDSGGRRTLWLHDARGWHHSRLDRWGFLWPPKDDAPRLPNPLAHKTPTTAFAREWGEAFAASPPGGARLPVPAAISGLLAKWRVPGPAAGPPPPPAVLRDVHGRIVSQTDAADRTERFERDAVGNVVRRTDPDGGVWSYQRTSWNLLGAESDPLGNTTRYRHNLRQYVSAVVDGAGNETAYEYDQKDRVARYIALGRVQETYRYDHGDRVIERRDGGGRLLVRYEVGPDGLHSRRELATGEEHRFAYDARGRFTEASTKRRKVEFAHGLSGRTADLRDGKGVTHAFQDGERVSTGYFGRYLVTYERLPDGGLALRTPDGGEHRVSRDAAGRTLRALANGSREASAYDLDGRCAGRVRWREDRPGEAHWTEYSYSGAGELRRVRDSHGGDRVCIYDAAHRLVASRPPQGPECRYAHDAAGNLVLGPEGRRFEVGPGNLLRRAGEERFVYDARGRLAERIDAAGRATRYRYDSLDLLVEVGWSDREEVWRGEHDGLCRLVAAGCGERRTEFFWDGDRLAAELAADGCLRLYVYPDADTFLPLLFIDYASLDAPPGSGRAFYPFHDQIGLPERIEDARGRTVWRAQATDAYGLIDVAPEGRLDYCLRFPGHLLIAETGLHYNRFRTYDPSLGRYLQPDPLGQKGGVNLYAYAANPAVFVDLLGLQCSEHPPNSSNEHADGAGPSSKGSSDADAPGSTTPASRRTYPQRTDEAFNACQAVHDSIGRAIIPDPTGRTKGERPVAKREAGSVAVYTHENGSRSVGISGANAEHIAPRVQEDLNSRGGGPWTVRGDVDQGLASDLRQDPNRGVDPASCAEPRAASAAHGNPSPINGFENTRRPGMENRHQLPPSDPQRRPDTDRQMAPCRNCGPDNNEHAINEWANR